MKSLAAQRSPKISSDPLPSQHRYLTEMAIFAGALVFILIEGALASGLIGSRELAIAAGLIVLIPGLLVILLRARVGGFGFGSSVILIMASGIMALVAHSLAFFSDHFDQVSILWGLTLSGVCIWTRLVEAECGPASDLGIMVFVSDCSDSIGELFGLGLVAWLRVVPGGNVPASLLAWEKHYWEQNEHQLTFPGDWQIIGAAEQDQNNEQDSETSSSRRTTARTARNEGYELGRDQMPQEPKSADPTFTVDVKHFPSRPISEILTELDGLIGLSEVKDQVRDLMALVEVGKQRLALGLQETGVSMHLRLLGAPGTGKTTVARLIAELLAAAGALPEAKMVEADRAALVGGYQGHTAAKVNAVVDAALGGVLFVDEAYALSQGAGDTFGGEALTTLLARAENDREHLAILLAGYGPEMADLMDQNPGLRSRFHRQITFNDFSVDELMEVAARETRIAHRDLSDEALVELRAGLVNLLASKDRHWGNGREVRSLIELAKLAQARRFNDETSLTATELTELDAADIRSALAQRQRAATPA
jgi:stage V sporulation protein K